MIYNPNPPFKWEMDVTLPYDEVMEDVSEKAYEVYQKKYSSGFQVILKYDFHPACPEVGLMSDSMNLSGWKSENTLPPLVESFIDTYMWHNGGEKYALKAYRQLCDYVHREEKQLG